MTRSNPIHAYATWVLVLMTCGLVGCPSTQQTKPDPETVEQLRNDSPFTRDDANAGNPANTAATEDEKTRYTLTVERLLYPRDNQRVTTALQNLPKLNFEQSGKQHLWQANGLRVSVISPHQLKLFMANLAEPIGNSPTTIPLVDKLSPLTLVSRIRGTLPVRVVEAGDVEEIKKLFSGKLQLFVKAEGGASVGETEAEGKVIHPRLEIIPHHYTPRLTIKLRDNTEKLFDGYTFNQLHLYETFDTSNIWVIWAELPTIIQPEDIRARRDENQRIEAKPIQPGEGSTNADATTKPGDTEKENQPGDESKTAPSGETRIPEKFRLPGDPMTLGEAMLSGMRQNTPVRVILMLRLYPAKPTEQ